MKLLEIENINTYYDLIHILFDVTLHVYNGETVCLLGRNGVGKTTTFRSIIGLTPPRTGSIKFNGKEIKGLKTHEISRMGIGLVPENRDIFPDLSVRENLEIAAKKSVLKKEEWNLDKVYNMFPILKEREKQMGGTLSGGEQQMLTIARTLMGNPILLLLDEPSEGLAPIIVKSIEEQIINLKKEGMTILLSEQNSSFALKVSDRAYILEKGHVTWTGYTSELKERPNILKRYLGI